MRIGAHVPVGDGWVEACGYAADVGCECLQVFAKSPRMWAGPPRDPSEAKSFRAERARLGLGPLFTHAAYLINLGSDDPLLWERSCSALADELTRAAMLGADGVVVHAGTTYAGAHHTPVGRVAAGVELAWRAASESAADVPPVLIENSAGAGRAFGSGMADLCAAAAEARARGVSAGVCFDTCHGFAAGIDVSRPKGWTAVCDIVDEVLGAGGLMLVHANDCTGGLGEHRDRHAWIGEGGVGEEGFAAMFREPRMADVPVVLEMPGMPPDKDRVNLDVLRRLRDAGAAACDRAPDSA